MKKTYQYISYILLLLIVFITTQLFTACNQKGSDKATELSKADTIPVLSLSKIPNDKYGEAVKYGRELMLHTAYYIGPDGINGKNLRNKMNCTNCHQNAGTKAYSLNLMLSFKNYPQYRAREGKVLTLAERVNNCVMHPHNGKPLPLDSKEMVAFLSYLKWISDSSRVVSTTKGVKNLQVDFPDTAASSKNGAILYAAQCARCHGVSGEGKMQADNVTYIYPPLWGDKGYQPGSSMHRVIKLAQWLRGNMPYDKATHANPTLSSAEALDLAAFINDDKIHKRPTVVDFQYPHYEEKSIDYDKGPFNDPFSEAQHKYGPYKPIIDYWKSKGRKPTY